MLYAKDLAKHIAATHNLPMTAANDMVEKVFNSIPEVLSERGERLIIRNFGAFTRKLRKPRIARNPATGERADVTAKEVVHFRPAAKPLWE